MSTGITFSGFNDIDFNVVLNAIMQQEQQPLQALETRQTNLKSRVTNFTTLTNRISSMQSAATALSTPAAASNYKATSNDGAAVGVSAGTAAVPGRYDIVVNELARAQVTASASSAPDADTTAVATGGTLTIGGEVIAIDSAMTLKQLSEAINANADAPARASVVQSGANSFKLVLTAKSTGEDNAFTITNAMTGGAGVTFTDTDLDGTSGDSAADNAVQATNAQVLVNNIAVTSASNNLDEAVPGATITLYKKDPAATIVVDVTADPGALKTKLQTFVTTYNDLVKFMNDQVTAAVRNNDSSIGRDPGVRQLKNSLRAALTSAYPNTGGLQYLSQLGVEMTRTGMLEIKDSVFDAAVADGADNAAKLLAGTTEAPGALVSIGALLKEYTKGAGVIQSAQTQINAQISRISDQMGRMEERLWVRRMALQQEFTAADAAMSRLKAQSGSLGGLSL
ncbi:MAG: flagellar filament capping protein FliD [Vicinamibacterales bacterium]